MQLFLFFLTQAKCDFGGRLGALSHLNFNKGLHPDA